MDRLPDGWESVKLGQILTFNYGKSLPKKERVEGPYNVYGSNGTIGSHSEALVEKPCIIVGRKGSFGKVKFSKNHSWPIDTTYFIDEFHQQPVSYWYRKLQYLPLTEMNRATAIPGLNRDDAYSLQIGLPPLQEQIRIAATIEALFDKCKVAEDRLESIPSLIHRYRQSILAAAFRGDLTKNWREKNPKVESSEKLLEKIREGRRKLWEESEFVKIQKKGKLTKTDEWKARYKSPAKIEIENLYKLPSTWSWVSLGELAWSVKDGPHYSPEYSSDGIPFISGGNIRPDGIDFSNTKFISKAVHEKLSERVKPELGDLLYTKGGTTGIARVNTYDKDYNVWVHVAVLKLVNEIEPFYLQHALNSPYCYNQSQKYTRGVGNQDLGLTRMVKIAVPLIPKEEQLILNSILMKAFERLAELERCYEGAAIKLPEIKRSILSKAFQGNLVPQDPTDEPADKLLKRIEVERMQLEKSLKKKRTNTRNKTKIMDVNMIIPITEALRDSKKTLTSQQLLFAAGYPNNADTYLIEQFFLDIRESLANTQIEMWRENNTDYFKLAV